MKKSMCVSILVLALGFSQLGWADGFGDEGLSDLGAYEGQTVSSDVGLVLAVFTPGIDVDGKPMGESERFFSSVKTVFFNTKLDGMVGKEIKHCWYYNGKMVSEETFVVDNEQFYAISRKNMLPDNIGEWRVEVRQQETLLEEKTFTYLAGL